MRRANYRADPSAVVAYVSSRRRRLKAEFKAYKETLVCERCGEDHPATIDFHHTDPTKKDVGLNVAIQRKGWSLQRLMEEVDKCEVLCSNCHRKEHWKRIMRGLSKAA